MNYPTIFIFHLFVTIKYFLEWYNNSLLTIQRIYLNVLYFALMTRIKNRVNFIQNGVMVLVTKTFLLVYFPFLAVSYFLVD